MGVSLGVNGRALQTATRGAQSFRKPNQYNYSGGPAGTLVRSVTIKATFLDKKVTKMVLWEDLIFIWHLRAQFFSRLSNLGPLKVPEFPKKNITLATRP